MKNLLITGSTGTGKTALAFRLAKLYQADIINADSRQLYQELNIITGKDIPISSLQFNKVAEIKSEDQIYQIGYYQDQGRKVWLYDLASVSQPISISLHYQACQKVFELIGNHTSKIIVGGSGLYLDNLIYPKDTAFIPPSQTLRGQLSGLSKLELQQQLAKLNPKKWQMMNNSDRQNPYRLVRAIEVNQSPVPSERITSFITKPLVIGLKSNQSTVADLIINRVKARLDQGAVAEVTALFAKYPNFQTLPGYRTLGYPTVTSYIHGQINLETLINTWSTLELQYTKRQLTWSAKRKYIHWFEIESKSWYDDVIELIDNHES